MLMCSVRSGGWRRERSPLYPGCVGCFYSNIPSHLFLFLFLLFVMVLVPHGLLCRNGIAIPREVVLNGATPGPLMDFA